MALWGLGNVVRLKSGGVKSVLNLTVSPELSSDASGEGGLSQVSAFRAIEVVSHTCSGLLEWTFMGLGAVQHPFSLPKAPPFPISILPLPYCLSFSPT